LSFLNAIDHGHGLYHVEAGLSAGNPAMPAVWPDFDPGTPGAPYWRLRKGSEYPSRREVRGGPARRPSGAGAPCLRRLAGASRHQRPDCGPQPVGSDMQHKTFFIRTGAPRSCHSTRSLGDSGASALIAGHAAFPCCNFWLPDMNKNTIRKHTTRGLRCRWVSVWAAISVAGPENTHSAPIHQKVSS
jgi:hypothetical protein